MLINNPITSNSPAILVAGGQNKPTSAPSADPNAPLGTQTTMPADEATLQATEVMIAKKVVTQELTIALTVKAVDPAAAESATAATESGPAPVSITSTPTVAEPPVVATTPQSVAASDPVTSEPTKPAATPTIVNTSSTSVPASTVVPDDDEHDDHHDRSLVGQVLGYIASQIPDDSDHDDDAHAAVVSDAQLKVTTAFHSAQTVLTEMGINSPSVTAAIDQSQSTVNGVLDQLVAPAATTAPAAMGQASAVDNTAATADYVGASTEQVTSLQVKTQEGDIVTVNISRSKGFAAAGTTDQNGTMIAASQHIAAQVSIGVEGKLSEDEFEAIEHLVSRVDKIAMKLFSGDSDSAFHKLGELEMDSEELVGFALNMSTKTKLEAVSAYSQVATQEAPAAAMQPTPAAGPSNVPLVKMAAPATPPASPVQPAPVVVEPPVVTAAQVARETAGLMVDTQKSGLLQNPVQDVRSLLGDIVNSILSSGNAGMSGKGMDFINKMLDDITGSVEEKHHAEESDHDDSDHDPVMSDTVQTQIVA